MVENIPEPIIDKIKSLWDAGWRKSDIVKHLRDAYPDHKWYFMKISRVVDSFKSDSEIDETTYRDIEDELEYLADWLRESVGISREQGRALDRRLSKIKRNIRGRLLEKSKNELELENASNFLQIGFVRECLEPSFEKHKGLREEVIMAMKKFWRSQGIPYYNDLDAEKKDLEGK